jgi:TonB family protein
MEPATGNQKLILAAMSSSLIVHLALFGMLFAMESTVKQKAVKEYISVDLVQPPARQPVVPIPEKARPRIVSQPRSGTVPAPAGAPQAPAPQTANRVAPLLQQQTEESAPNQLLSPRGPHVQGEEVAARERVPGSGHASASMSHVVAPPHNRSKGDYLAFHRLTRIPAFRVRAEPEYPDTERMTGNEARVVAEIYLDERGMVDEVIIKRSGGRYFDRTVLDAVRKSSFLPGYLGEKSVPTVIQIPYTFKLK